MDTAVLTPGHLRELFKYLSTTMVNAGELQAGGQVVCSCSSFALTRLFGRTHNVENSLIDFVEAENCNCDCDVLRLSKGVVGFTCSALRELELVAKLFEGLHDCGPAYFLARNIDRTLEIAGRLRADVAGWSNVATWKGD